jgi:hypothetical protein
MQPDEIKHSKTLVIDTADEYKTVQELKLKFWVVKTVVYLSVFAFVGFSLLLAWFVFTKPTDGALIGTGLQEITKVISVLFQSAIK